MAKSKRYVDPQAPLDGNNLPLSSYGSIDSKYLPNYKANNKNSEVRIGDTGSANYLGNRYERSPYDDPNTYEEDIPYLNDIRTENQGFLSSVGNSTGKFIGKTALNIAGGIAGTVYGAGLAFADKDVSKLWDNSFTQKVDDIDKGLDDIFKVYKSSEYLDQNILQRAFLHPLQFIDDTSDALSFTAGAILTELGTAGIASEIAIPKAIKYMKYLSEGAEAAEATRNMSSIGRSILNGAGNFGRVTRQLATGASYESIVEARQATLQLRDKMYSDYAKENPGREMPESVKSDIDDRLSKAGLFTYLSNLALVGSTNMVEFPKIFGLGYKTSKVAAGSIERDAETGLFNSAKKSFKDLSTLDKAKVLLKNPFQEGIKEEGLQNVISGTNRQFFDRKNDDDSKNIVSKYLSDAADNLANTYTSKEGWNDIGMGMIIGALGAPGRGVLSILGEDNPIGRYGFDKVYNEKGEVIGTKKAAMWTGGIKGSIDEHNAEVEHIQSVVDDLNKHTSLFKSMKANYDFLVQSQSLQEEKEKAVDAGDIFGFNNAKDDQIHAYTAARIKAGKYEDILDTISDMKKMSPDEFYSQFRGEEATNNATTVEKTKFQHESIQEFTEKAANTKEAYDIVDNNYKGNNDNIREELAHSIAAAKNLDVREKGINQSLADLSNGMISNYSLRGTHDSFLRGSISSIEDQLKNKDLSQEDSDALTSQLIDYKRKLQLPELAALHYLEQNNPTAATLNGNKIVELLSDSKKLREKRQNYLDLYNHLFTEKGQQQFQKHIEEVQDIAKKAEEAKIAKQTALQAEADKKKNIKETIDKVSKAIPTSDMGGIDNKTVANEDIPNVNFENNSDNKTEGEKNKLKDLSTITEPVKKILGSFLTVLKDGIRKKTGETLFSSIVGKTSSDGEVVTYKNKRYLSNGNGVISSNPTISVKELDAFIEPLLSKDELEKWRDFKEEHPEINEWGLKELKIPTDKNSNSNASMDIINPYGYGWNFVFNYDQPSINAKANRVSTNMIRNGIDTKFIVTTIQNGKTINTTTFDNSDEARKFNLSQQEKLNSNDEIPREQEDIKQDISKNTDDHIEALNNGDNITVEETQAKEQALKEELAKAQVTIVPEEKAVVAIEDHKELVTQRDIILHEDGLVKNDTVPPSRRLGDLTIINLDRKRTEGNTIAYLGQDKITLNKFDDNEDVEQKTYNTFNEDGSVQINENVDTKLFSQNYYKVGDKISLNIPTFIEMQERGLDSYTEINYLDDINNVGEFPIAIRSIDNKIIGYLPTQSGIERLVNDEVKDQALASNLALRENIFETNSTVQSTITSKSPGYLILDHPDNKKSLFTALGNGSNRLADKVKLGIVKLGELYINNSARGKFTDGEIVNPAEEEGVVYAIVPSSETNKYITYPMEVSTIGEDKAKVIVEAIRLFANKDNLSETDKESLANITEFNFNNFSDVTAFVNKIMYASSKPTASEYTTFKLYKDYLYLSSTSDEKFSLQDIINDQSTRDHITSILASRYNSVDLSKLNSNRTYTSYSLEGNTIVENEHPNYQSYLNDNNVITSNIKGIHIEDNEYAFTVQPVIGISDNITKETKLLDPRTILKSELWEDDEGRRYQVNYKEDGNQYIEALDENNKRITSIGNWKGEVNTTLIIHNGKKISDLEVKNNPKLNIKEVSKSINNIVDEISNIPDDFQENVETETTRKLVSLFRRIAVNDREAPYTGPMKGSGYVRYLEESSNRGLEFASLLNAPKQAKEYLLKMYEEFNGKSKEVPKQSAWTSRLNEIRRIYTGGATYFNIEAAGGEVADNLKAGNITIEELANLLNSDEVSGKLRSWFERGYKSLTAKDFTTEIETPKLTKKTLFDPKKVKPRPLDDINPGYLEKASVANGEDLRRRCL